MSNNSQADTTDTRPLPAGCKMDHPSKYASDETCDVCGLGEGDACKAYDDQVASRRSNRSVPTRPQMGDEERIAEIKMAYALLDEQYPKQICKCGNSDCGECSVKFLLGVIASLPEPTVHAPNCNISEKLSGDCSCGASTPAQSVLVEARLLSAAKLLFANALACVEQHHGRDTASNGLPGWLADAKADIEAVADTASALARDTERRPANTGRE